MWARFYIADCGFRISDLGFDGFKQGAFKSSLGLKVAVFGIAERLPTMRSPNPQEQGPARYRQSPREAGESSWNARAHALRLRADSQAFNRPFNNQSAIRNPQSVIRSGCVTSAEGGRRSRSR